MNLGRNASKKELLLFGLVVAMMMVAIPRVAYRPFADQIQSSTQRMNSMEIEKQALVNFTVTTPTLEKTETLHAKGIKMKVLLGEINSEYKDVTTLLNALTDRSFLGNITIQKLGYQSPRYDEGYSQTPFAMQISGPFPELVQYIERLEQFPALFNIHQMVLKTITDSQGINVVLEGNIYRFEKTNPNKPEGDAKNPQSTSRGGGKI